MLHPGLSPEQRTFFEAAVAEISLKRLRDVNRTITGIHSPTGRERELAEWLVSYMQGIGLDASYQPMTELSGNAIGRKRGNDARGTSLLLYAPIDTHMEGDASDLPWCGPVLRPDMQPTPIEQDGMIIGLGASNPKAMATTIAEAVRAVLAVKAPLAGDLLLGYAGGGMPLDVTAAGRRGLSDGVAHLLSRGVHADFGLVMKPGNAVSYEEPGLCWFKVVCEGTLGYAGMRHDLPNFRSSIVPMAKVILELEEWLTKYTVKNTSGLVAPQGWIAAVQGGSGGRAAFPSATTELFLDIRCNPRTPPAEVKAQFAEAIDDIQRRLGVELSWEMVAALPGARTDPENWIIQSARRAWEEVEGKPHPPPRVSSGQTDISMIRNLGIPTARTGWVANPEATPAEYLQGLGGMGVARPEDFVPVCRKLVYSIIDTCMRLRSDTGAVKTA